MQTAKRLELIPPYLFAEIARKIRAKREQGVDVISLGIGDPDQPTPNEIIDEAVRDLRDPNDPDRHRYGGDVPVPDFPQAVAEFYQSRFGVTLDPKTEVLTTIGSKDGIAHIPWAFIDPGDVALVPQPGYPVYNIGTLFAGGESHFMPLRAENNWLPDLSAIPADIAKRAKVMWLNYPNNPTAAVAPLEFFQEAVEFARQHDILICHDAPYAEIAYDGYRASSILQVEGAKEVAIEFNSLSKHFNMTGWRIGMAVGNAEALKALGLIKENVDSGVLRAIQFAGAKALRDFPDYGAEISAKIYKPRMDLIIGTLNKIGWNLQAPKATFYIWAPVPPGFDGSSAKFAEHLLEQAGVVVTPGRGYGEAGEGYFRVSLTYPENRLREAMERIEKALK
ncbi:MAG: LL-diaminopimelate aminotransferase [Abitibacteriaceae bacterium]|nr:LL-diaminopimelate aminotransferase [Abditibacteriaceae bacterium]